MKFKVYAVPTLILVDGKTGELITKNGREIVVTDPKGTGFPWRPRTLSEIFEGIKFIDKDNDEKTWDQLHGMIIGFFFSCHWVSQVFVCIGGGEVVGSTV